MNFSHNQLRWCKRKYYYYRRSGRFLQHTAKENATKGTAMQCSQPIPQRIEPWHASENETSMDLDQQSTYTGNSEKGDCNKRNIEETPCRVSRVADDSYRYQEFQELIQCIKSMHVQEQVCVSESHMKSAIKTSNKLDAPLVWGLVLNKSITAGQCSIIDHQSLINRILKPEPMKPMRALCTSQETSPLLDCNIVSITCDHNERILSNKEGGIKIAIPKHAIKEGNLVTISTAISLYGPFILPLNSQADLASPYYWIGATGSYHFQKPIEVEFEHYGACDPSHYRLLSCEDGFYTMQPVDYELEFTVRDDNMSCCRFQTVHFCSYCLLHNCKVDDQLSTIGIFILKPKTFQWLNRFTVEIWFSFATSYCLKRNKELFEKRGMRLDARYTFRASCHRDSESYLTLKYDKSNEGWCLDHTLSTVIPTKEINFYNYFKNVEDLLASEECLLFPPRFTLNVAKKSEHTINLGTKLTVTLCETKNKEEILFDFYLSLKVNEEACESAVANVASTEPDLYGERLMRILNDVPYNRLTFLVNSLLPGNSATKVMEDIRYSNGSKEDDVKKICEAFLKEENPSWTKVRSALIEAKCVDLADIIEACFL